MTPKENVPLAPLTTFKTGGSARYLLEVENPNDLLSGFQFAQAQNLPVFILGGGTNVLVSDTGFDGLVLKVALKGITYKEQGDFADVVVASGEAWDAFVLDTLSHGFRGLENLSGIPGTVGGTPIQNVGAYGVEVGNVIAWVEVFDPLLHSFKVFSNTECRFSYRHSMFKEEGKHFVITKVCFHLARDTPLTTSYADVTRYLNEQGIINPTVDDIRKAVLSIRARKFPDLTIFGTAGSYFKNPIVSKAVFDDLAKRFRGIPGFPIAEGQIKLSLAWLLDRGLSWRGRRTGDVGAYENQPLVIVNFGGAHAKDIKKFADMIVRDVRDKTSLTIEQEITFLGSF